VAVTMANPEDHEIVWASFPIEKMETDADGDLVVYGKASDGGLDSDNQIVDPAWMAKAAPLWLETGGNVRVQHNPQRDPAGIGVKVETDSTGATYVTAKVFEPVAQKLVSRGALRAYSVGIAKPTIVRDASAPGGRITGGELVEISLVDRPANKRCGIALVKSEAGAPAEYVGEIFGTAEDIGKALAEDIVKGFQTGDSVPPFASITELHTPETTKSEDITLTFTPNDLMRIVQNKFVEKHYDELAWQAVAEEEAEALKASTEVLEKDHREFTTSRRKDLASQGNALPDGSYPIPDADALHRASVLARSGHGNVSGARALIARRAKELGVANPLTSGDTKKDEVVDVIKAEEAVESVKEADPVVTKDPADTPPKKGKKGKAGKKLPPWLADQAASDAQKADAPCDDQDEDDDDDATCKADHAHTEKCSGTPQSASGAKDAAPMKEIPNTGEAVESPMPAGRKTPDTKAVVPEMHASPEVSALLRFKTIGIDTDLGRLHDMTCPAFSPEDVAKYHPFADFKSTVDTGIWQRKAVDAACGDLAVAKSMTQIWQAAEALKFADEADLNDYRAEMHKAFRDANPGPTSYPSPGSISPEKYNRPLVTDGHSATSPGHDGPNSSAMVATSPSGGVNSFSSPPLSSGHQSPSPSHMKNEFEVPTEAGKPTVIHYAAIEKEKARRALSMMHDHLMHAFPQACPMLAQNAYAVEDGAGSPALNPVVGVTGKEETIEVVESAPVEKAVTDYFNDEWIQKAQKKMRKKLGKKVLAGKITVDEARAKMGRNIAQKSEDLQELVIEQVEKGLMSVDEARAQLGLAPLTKAQEPVVAKAEVLEVKGVDADVIKSAVSDAVKPFLDQLNAQNSKIDELNAYKAEAESRFEKLADLADPSTAGFVGMMNPVQKGRPAGVPAQAEIAERTQQMMIRQLQRTARVSDNPAEREAAQDALMKYGNFE
jgi:hypothetical protein